MFDTVAGLPVHALVVHAAVVLVPLAALLSVAVAVVPRLRAVRRLLWLVVAVDVGAFAITVVTKLSGQELRSRLGGQIAADHARRGGVMPWFALALVAAVVLLAFAARRTGALTGIAVALVVVTAAAASGWTVWTGHSGSAAVWESVVQSTQPPGG